MSSESHEKIAQIICHKPEKISCEECFQKSLGHICNGFSQCRILEKTEEQLAYVLSSSHKNIFLKACAGSGKTEVVGMKAAYEIKKWNKQHSGIAVLSFTNDATNVIKERVKQFAENNGTYPHFIGTLSSFIHSYIVQPFAYKLIKYSSNSSDYSIRIIDENMYIYENHWLSKFKCKIPFIHSQESIFTNIYAHQIGYDLEKKDFYIIMKYDLIWLTNYYNSQNVQSYITEKRKNYSTFWEENWVRKCFCDCKKEFWENGFANFDDMNILAIRILKTPIAEQIVKRFPLLLIDECQDLSENELHVIKLLQKNGCYVHFIGDLNQSIYDFKRVNPDKIYDYISNFKTYKLSANFRSCKEIVNFSNRLIKEQNYSKHVHSKFGKNALIVIEYNNPKDAIKKYVDYLKTLKCEDGINRILVKQNSLRKQLQNLTQNTYDEKAPLIVALQLWKEKTPNNMIESLVLAGKQISKWFGGGTSKKNYYCPNEISSIFVWRIYLMNILNDMEKNDALSDFNLTYGEWYKFARKELNPILKKHYKLISAVDSKEERDITKLVNGNNFKVSSGNTDIQILPYRNEFITDIPITTIHRSKGCTFDTTLVISSENAKSEGGHWKKHWLEGEGEKRRIGYVASTRAKYLLALGVPKLTKSDRELLKHYGFIFEIEIDE